MGEPVVPSKSVQTYKYTHENVMPQGADLPLDWPDRESRLCDQFKKGKKKKTAFTLFRQKTKKKNYYF